MRVFLNASYKSDVSSVQWHTHAQTTLESVTTWIRTQKHADSWLKLISLNMDVRLSTQVPTQMTDHITDK